MDRGFEKGSFEAPMITEDGNGIESDSGGPGARILEHPRERARTSLASGMRVLAKRKREEATKRESHKRQNRRLKERQTALTNSVAGFARITNFTHEYVHVNDQGDLGSKTGTRTTVHGPSFRNPASKTPSLEVGSSLNHSQMYKSQYMAGHRHRTAERLNLDFIQACKKRAHGGANCDSSHLSTRFVPPCPLQRGLRNPAYFMMLPVNILSPLEQFPLLCRNVKCRKKGPSGMPCDGSLRPNGWSNGEQLPRKIFSLKGDEFVIVRVYQCDKKACNKYTTASHPLFFSSLPNAVQQCYKFVLSKKGGITRDFVDILMDSYVSGLPFEAVANDRNARARELYLMRVEGFASLCFVSSRNALDPQVSIKNDYISRFGSFKDLSGYGGRALSAKRLAVLYKSLHAGRRDLIDRSLQSTRAKGCSAAFDDTFKVPKKLRSVGGGLFSCLKSVKCSNGLMLWYQVAESKGALSALPALINLGERLGEDGGMHTMYSDQCCADRSTFMRAFPSLAKSDTNHSSILPSLDARSSLLSVVTSTSELEGSLGKLKETAMPACEFSGQRCIAIDAEWTAAINSGVKERGKVGVLQLSTRTITVVIDLVKVLRRRPRSERIPLVPSCLSNFMGDPDFCFVGVCVKNDCNYLRDDYGLLTKNVIDLRMLYKLQGYSRDERHGSLAYFVETILKMSLPCKESRGVRTSLWSDGLRTIDQQEYAATDVWATAIVYDSMRSLEKLPASRALPAVPVPKNCIAGTTVNEEPNKLSTYTSTESTMETSGQLEHEQDHLFDEPNRSVKLDPFHFIQRFTEEVRGGPSTAIGRLLAVMMSMALLEESEADRNAIQNIALVGGATSQEARRLPRSAYKRRVRRMIPIPSVLKRRIIAVYDAFRHVKTPDGLSFFKPGMASMLKAALVHIEKGCLSDTLNVSLYSGEPCNVMKCERGSSSLEAFRRHLRAAFPGFSYGAELFDAILSEYIFRTNARAIARIYRHTGPRSVSEIVAFERLYATCSSFNVTIPDEISLGLRPLPPNNGEVFGFEDLGDWARRVRDAGIESPPDEDVDSRDGDDNAMNPDTDEHQYVDLDGTVIEHETVHKLVSRADFSAARSSGNIKATRLQSLIQALRGRGATSEVFLAAICQGEKVRKPTSSQEMRFVNEAMKREEKFRITAGSKNLRPRRRSIESLQKFIMSWC